MTDNTVHWIGDAPTSLHGNGASSFEHTTRSVAEVTCRLCRSQLRLDPPAAVTNTEGDAATDLARALNAADVDYSAREHRADAGDGEMEPGDWFTFIARAALAWMRENDDEKREPDAPEQAALDVITRVLDRDVIEAATTPRTNEWSRLWNVIVLFQEAYRRKRGMNANGEALADLLWASGYRAERQPVVVDDAIEMRVAKAILMVTQVGVDADYAWSVQYAEVQEELLAQARAAIAALTPDAQEAGR